jgi:hypothetical protein
VTRRAWGALGILMLVGGPARAQSHPLPGRIEAAVGVAWAGRTSLGSIDATETTGAGGVSRIFSTTTEIASAAAIEGRVAFRLPRRLEVEATAAYATPLIKTTISNDVEASGTVVATETISQFTFGGALLWYVPQRELSRLRPFLALGAGYVRQLHESKTLAATGQSYQIGGGVKYLFGSTPTSRLRAIGVRADGRLVAARKGVAFDDGTRFAPALGASFFVRF